MSKMLEATCAAGVVTSGGVPVPAADILSEGQGPSSGVLILDEDTAKYITSNASDLKSTLDQLATALTAIATALTAIDAKPIGVISAPPVAAAAVVQILAAQVQVTVLKELLK